MTSAPPTCRFPDDCDWSSGYDECSREACYDPDAAALADQLEQPFLDPDDLDDELPGFDYVPGYSSHLGAQGGAWPATRRPEYRDWPDHITDLRLPEETL